MVIDFIFFILRNLSLKRSRNCQFVRLANLNWLASDKSGNAFNSLFYSPWYREELFLLKNYLFFYLKKLVKEYGSWHNLEILSLES